MFLQTDRIILRQWEEKDLEPFAQLNADPRVMEYFPKLLTREESDDIVRRLKGHIEKYGWGFWAASLISTGELVGLIGMQHVGFNAPFTPAVEIGWRLAQKYWGQGYAPEGAIACLQYAFNTLELDQVVAFTFEGNLRSRRVMEKIGMHHNAKDDFNHPQVLPNHPLMRHVLYRIYQQEYLHGK